MTEKVPDVVGGRVLPEEPGVGKLPRRVATRGEVLGIANRGRNGVVDHPRRALVDGRCAKVVVSNPERDDGHGDVLLAEAHLAKGAVDGRNDDGGGRCGGETWDRIHQI
jgi:hypothetical protein